MKLKPSDKAWIAKMRKADNSIWHCSKCNDLSAIPQHHPTIKIPKKWDCRTCGTPLEKIEDKP